MAKRQRAPAGAVRALRQVATLAREIGTRAAGVQLERSQRTIQRQVKASRERRASGAVRSPKALSGLLERIERALAPVVAPPVVAPTPPPPALGPESQPAPRGVPDILPAGTQEVEPGIYQTPSIDSLPGLPDGLTIYAGAAALRRAWPAAWEYHGSTRELSFTFFEDAVNWFDKFEHLLGNEYFALVLHHDGDFWYITLYDTRPRSRKKKRKAKRK